MTCLTFYFRFDMFLNGKRRYKGDHSFCPQNAVDCQAPMVFEGFRLFLFPGVSHLRPFARKVGSLLFYFTALQVTLSRFFCRLIFFVKGLIQFTLGTLFFLAPRELANKFSGYKSTRSGHYCNHDDFLNTHLFIPILAISRPEKQSVSQGKRE